MKSAVSFEAAEAEECRQRIRETVDELKRRLSPDHIISDTVASLERSGSAIAAAIRDAITTEPVPALSAAVAFSMAMLKDGPKPPAPRPAAPESADAVLEQLTIPALASGRPVSRAPSTLVGLQPLLGIGLLMIVGGGLAYFAPSRAAAQR